MLLLAGVWLAAAATLAEPGYVGSEVCTACHEEAGKTFAHTVHGKLFNDENALSAKMKLGCEACHGPGGEHVSEGGGKIGVLGFRAEGTTETERENGACLSCHSGNQRLYWDGSVHETRDVACTSCHSSHDPKSDRHQLIKSTEMDTCASCHLIQRSRQFRNSRMPVREGHMSCGSCHNAHGSVTQALIHQNTVNDNCYSCHAEKRGPFLWEHAPVSENCLSCHDPHGSTKRAMLKLNQPRLCQQCHVATRHPSNPQSPDNRFVVSGGCTNCHAQVHGTNHPAGFVLSR
jgi:DmsE family decaheme c-type cytochrome